MNHHNDPLHGVTLEAMLVALQNHYGWEGLGEKISIRCFTHDPSIKSSLKFLRRTPWARAKVEDLYRALLRRTQPDTRQTALSDGKAAKQSEPVADQPKPRVIPKKWQSF